jgi:protein TonB
MSYKALLFCPDERTAKTLTQVLTELEFQVEACNEPFAAVKKLMAGHFDAVVVDCDNEQNATLMFKSARNSEFNQASLSVAVVEGQSGVAKAFRIGANLVLTKPINVEQSKGTLRVARGLLRKNEAAKTSGKAVEIPSRPAVTSPSRPASISAVSAKPSFVTTPAPSFAPSATASSAFEVEKDPTPEPEPAEAALLESMSDPVTHKVSASDAAPTPQYPWQAKSASEPVAEMTKSESTMAAGMSTALKHAAEATNKTSSGISVGSGAAVAPAKEPIAIDDEISALEEPAEFSAPGPAIVAKPHAPASPINWGRIAAIVLLAAAAGAVYRAGTLTHWKMPSSSLLQQARAYLSQHAAPATSQIAKPAASSPAATTPAVTISTTAAQPSTAATVTPQNPNQSLTAPGAVTQKPSPVALSPSAPTFNPKKPAVPATSFDPPTPPGVVKTIAEGTVFVNTQTPRPAPPKPATVESVEPASPDAFSADSHSSDQAISGLMNMPSTVPQPGPQTLKISQGVSQGLLVTKVAPVYPARAMQTHVQGAVQMLATISKDGDITGMKLLSGEPILAKAAMDAVKQWKYKPYLLNGQPMAIQTQITVNFTLP